MLKLNRQNRNRRPESANPDNSDGVALTPVRVTDKVEPYTYIHKGTLLEGNLSATGRVRVAGTLKGNLKVEGVVEITEGGLVEGKLLEADTVVIIGQVRANVKAHKKMEIWKKGVLQGDVQANIIDIEEGATFIGRSDMRPAADFSTSAAKTDKRVSGGLTVDAEALLIPEGKRANDKKVASKTEAA